MKPARTVRKAVLPVAGLGTRFLPATKAQPKEMLALVDKPLIQYAVEEAVASGIEEIILVTGPGKDAIADYFAAHPELVRELEERGKKEEAALLRRLETLTNIVSVQQEKPLGLGHAVSCARELVGQEPFAVLLPDDLIDAPVPCTRQLLDVYAAHPGCVIATTKIAGAAIENYGVMAVEPVSAPARREWKDRLFGVTDLVEKPKAAEAPSSYGVLGRYVLEPEIFAAIDATPPGRDGEIQLTDALRRLARAPDSGKRAVYAFAVDGHHSAAGDKLGFLQATIHYALKDPQLGPAFRAYLKSLKL